MRIGILTYHYGINHGAFLQAYCLQEYLRKNFPKVDIEIINYHSRIYDKAELKAFIFFRPFRKKLKIRFYNFLKFIAFKRSQIKYLNLTKRIYNIEDIDTNKYNLVILGSDEIWNVKHWTGYTDPTYFGIGIQNSTIISYAPSFGSSSIEDIPDYLKNMLGKLDSISVRDENSENIINQLGLNCTKVVDPTFLYSIKHQNATKQKVKQAYILIYVNHMSQQNIKEIKKYALERSLIIVGIGYSYSWVDKNLINIDPFEWISFFKHSSFVVTNTFHGAVFSILSAKNFLILEVIDKAYKIDSLLQSLNLHYLKSDLFSPDKLSEINYSEINSILHRNIQISQDYLKQQIDK